MPKSAALSASVAGREAEGLGSALAVSTACSVGGRPCGVSGCGPSWWQLRQRWLSRLVCAIPPDTLALGAPLLKDFPWQSAHTASDIECDDVSGPGERKCQRPELPSRNNSAPNVKATVSCVVNARRARTLRTGAHAVPGWQQVPSGFGPSAHGPPAAAARVQNHRSPFRRGAHSLVAPQFPCASGPRGQGLPSASAPHTHF